VIASGPALRANSGDEAGVNWGALLLTVDLVLIMTILLLNVAVISNSAGAARASDCD
jgi:hypothetical protein